MRLTLFLATSLCVAACTPHIHDDHSHTNTVSDTYVAQDGVAKSLPDLSEALATGDITSAALTQTYLDRIETVDRNGPKLQSILALNPDAMAQARASDARRAKGEALDETAPLSQGYGRKAPLFSARPISRNGPIFGQTILFRDGQRLVDKFVIHIC